MAAARGMTSSSGLLHFVSVVWSGLAGRNAITISPNIIVAHKRYKSNPKMASSSFVLIPVINAKSIIFVLCIRQIQ